jgi:hypothetical protein
MTRKIGFLIALSCAAMFVNPMAAQSKTFQDKSCRRDYQRLCPQIPIGKCHLETMIEKLSPACKTFVQKNK